MKQDHSIKGSILPVPWIEWKWPSLLEKKVADLGCGKGAMAQWFADQGAFVDAFDIQDVFGSSKNIEFKVRDVFSPQFQIEKSYDIVLASFLLNFQVCDQQVAFMEKIAHGVREGGLLAFSWLDEEDSYFTEPSQDWKCYPGGGYIVNEKWKFMPVREDQIIKALENIGFCIVYKEHEGRNVYERINRNVAWQSAAYRIMQKGVS